MLRISKLADYGTVIMHYLALEANELHSAASIAEQVDLPAPTVSKVLKTLMSTGLVVSERGAEGGYKLARSADDISVADVIAAIEGMPSLTECGAGATSCSHNKVCSLRDNWQLVNRVILTALQSLSLQDMTGSLQHHPLVEQGIKFQKVIPVARVEG